MPDNKRQGSCEFSSPACMLHELDPAFAAHAESPPPEASAQDWNEVRLWRKVKREVLIGRRLAMPDADRASQSARITHALGQLLTSQPGALIGFYWPFKGEYDPRPLARSLHAQGLRLALPVVVRKANPVVFRGWWPGIPMESGAWNIPVPACGDPVDPELLLVPLVGFDRSNYRLGYGGGYYDRTLAAARVRPRTVGVGFELSRIATIYPQAHDIPMDQIVTGRVVA